MNKAYIAAILSVTRLAFNSGAMGQIRSKNEYMTAEKIISKEYKSDQQKCESLPYKAKKICMAVATNKVKLAKIELDARYIPAD